MMPFYILLYSLKLKPGSSTGAHPSLIVQGVCYTMRNTWRHST